MSAVIMAAMAASAQAQQPGSPERGLRFARQVCSECHLVVKETGRSTNPTAPAFEAIARTPGMTSVALSVALQTSHRTMPNIVIAADDLRDVTAYILSLKERD